MAGDNILGTSLTFNNNDIGSPAFSSKSSVFEDALTVQHRPFSSSLTFVGNEKGNDISRALTALGVISIVSTIMAILSVVLIFRLDYKQDSEQPPNTSETGWGGKIWCNSLLDTGTVLSSFCVMLNLHCMLVCIVQSFVASKMLKLPQGEERSLSFLKKTSGMRFFAVGSFFLSIPLYLIALCAYLLLEFRPVAAGVSSGLLILGVFMTIVTFCHSLLLWQREKHRVKSRLRTKFDVSHVNRFTYTNHVGKERPGSENNLSTLV